MVTLINKVRDFLAGKKTYIVSALIILQAAISFVSTGDTTAAVKQILEGLGLTSLRAGITK